MRGKILGVLLTVIFCLGMLTPVAASPSAFTGDPALDNWLLQGNSLTIGTYIRGPGGMDFDVYSSVFSLDAGSPLVGGQWQVGDLILGLGGVSQSAGNDSVNPKLVAKFGAAGATFSPSTLPSPDGNGVGSFSGGAAGSGGVQILLQYLTKNGDIRIPDIVTYSPTTVIAQDFGRVRAIFEGITSGNLLSFEVALDLTYLSREDYSPTPSQTGKADMAWDAGHSGIYTDAYVPNMGAVPVPGTLLLLGSGLMGLGLLRRQWSLKQ